MLTVLFNFLFFENFYENVSYRGFWDMTPSFNEKCPMFRRVLAPSSSQWSSQRRNLLIRCLNLQDERAAILQNVGNTGSLPRRFESLTHITPPFIFFVWLTANICKAFVSFCSSCNSFVFSEGIQLYETSKLYFLQRFSVRNLIVRCQLKLGHCECNVPEMWLHVLGKKPIIFWRNCVICL